jgi:Protein of unknown function (DUF3667)
MRRRKIRRKTHICPNCETVLDRDENYCHVCGQENHNLNAPMKDLLMEIIGSFTFFETKFIETARYIFTHPGKLTLDFNSGKRARYMHPVRMYFWVSAILFFTFGLNLFQEKDKRDAAINNARRESKSYDEGKKFGRDVVKIVKSGNDKEEKQAKNSPIEDKKRGWKDAKKEDSLKRKKQKDYYYLGTTKRLIIQKDSIVYYHGLSDAQLDSVLDAKHFNTYFIFKQPIKNSIEKEYENYLNEKYQVPVEFDRREELISTMPTLMFIMLPLAAFILWFFERRTKWKFYFQHLVFTLNTHSALYLMFAFLDIITELIEWSINKPLPSSVNTVLAVFLLIVSFGYFLLSLKNVYQQTWLKTIIKFFLLTFTYSVFFLILFSTFSIVGLIKF